MQKISLLEDQLKDKHQSALNKLQNLLDTKSNFPVKMNRTEMSLNNMNDLEKLLTDKDNTIRALEMELKSIKEENNKKVKKVHKVYSFPCRPLWLTLKMKKMI